MPRHRARLCHERVPQHRGAARPGTGPGAVPGAEQRCQPRAAGAVRHHHRRLLPRSQVGTGVPGQCSARSGCTVPLRLPKTQNLPAWLQCTPPLHAPKAFLLHAQPKSAVPSCTPQKCCCFVHTPKSPPSFMLSKSAAPSCTSQKRRALPHTPQNSTLFLHTSKTQPQNRHPFLCTPKPQSLYVHPKPTPLHALPKTTTPSCAPQKLNPFAHTPKAQSLCAHPKIAVPAPKALSLCPVVTLCPQGAGAGVPRSPAEAGGPAAAPGGAGGRRAAAARPEGAGAGPTAAGPGAAPGWQRDLHLGCPPQPPL